MKILVDSCEMDVGGGVGSIEVQKIWSEAHAGGGEAGSASWAADQKSDIEMTPCEWPDGLFPWWSVSF